jgi:DNA-binding HxlR family transcriptional regulator
MHAKWRGAVMRQLRLATEGDPATAGELRRTCGAAGCAAERWLSRELVRWVEAGIVVSLRRGVYCRGPNWEQLRE